MSSFDDGCYAAGTAGNKGAASLLRSPKAGASHDGLLVNS